MGIGEAKRLLVQYHIYAEDPKAPLQHSASAPQTMTATTFASTALALSRKTSIIIPDEKSTDEEADMHETYLAQRMRQLEDELDAV